MQLILKELKYCEVETLIEVDIDLDNLDLQDLIDKIDYDDFERISTRLITQLDVLDDYDYQVIDINNNILVDWYPI